MIAVDIGFGWTKCFKEGVSPVKFPTWIAYWSGEAVSDIKPIIYEGKEYVVGDLARHLKHRIEIADFGDLIRWTPVIIRHVLNAFGEEKIVGGIPPKYYAQYKKDVLLREKLDRFYHRVYPQGFGILVDTEEAIGPQEGETILVLDIGFNTVDYFLVSYSNQKYIKLAGGTLENLGVLKAVEIFRASLPENGSLKDFSRSQLLKVFESGMARVEGKEIDLKSYRNKAVEVYTDLLRSRLKTEFSINLLEADRVVVAGGGAHIIKGIRHDAYIPPEPEFSNVRGYLKASS